ncbi:hypothetical protein [Mucilaginibacter sp. PPCGB 2223]|uniref:hypothetical protein n=1 Tax=Mucilaginibacter sp. PPCGB 2223 TaxID=1886027 RepID=UPI001112C5FE|nr:hypothetical protein [Mucilaginibacter sp. PPCGB 2223]
MVIHYFMYFQFLSLLLSIIYYRGLKTFKLLGFIPLLLIVCFTEITAANPSFVGLPNNHGIYNYYLLFSTPVTFYIFLQMLYFKGWVKSLYILTSALLVLFVVINFLVGQGPLRFDTYSLILIEFLTGLLTLLVIAKLFREDDSPIYLNRHPYFWIAASTLIFSIVTLIVLGMQQFIEVKKIRIGNLQIYSVIMPMINVFLYGCYSYAFYLCRKLTSNS